MYGSYDKFVKPNVNPETAIAIEATTGVKATWNFQNPEMVTRVGVQVTTGIDYNTATALCKVAFKKYPTYGSSSGAVVLGTIEIPNAMAAGSVLYLDIPNTAPNRNAEVKAGEQVVAEVTVRGAGGAYIAGDYQPFICTHPRAEVDGNQDYMVECADAS